MNRPLRLSTCLSLLAVLLLAACAKTPSDEHVVNEPVRLEEIQSASDNEGDDLHRVIFTAEAAERTGIETALVEKRGDRLVVPHSAILFDPEGRVWVYTNPEPLAFVRHEVKVDTEEGNTAVLTDGPPPGTRVVTIGVPELYGAEYEVGH
jgi:hypothetical protein